MCKHWLTKFWSFQSVEKVTPSIELRHVPELFGETYSACKRFLSVPKFFLFSVFDLPVSLIL